MMPMGVAYLLASFGCCCFLDIPNKVGMFPISMRCIDESIYGKALDIDWRVFRGNRLIGLLQSSAFGTCCSVALFPTFA